LGAERGLPPPFFLVAFAAPSVPAASPSCVA
jgi:hypothetical protein